MLTTSKLDIPQEKAEGQLTNVFFVCDSSMPLSILEK